MLSKVEETPNWGRAKFDHPEALQTIFVPANGWRENICHFKIFVKKRLFSRHQFGGETARAGSVGGK